MINRFEKPIIEIIRGERTGWNAEFIKLILTPLSWIYSGVSRCRNLFYDKGLTRQHHSRATVVSVGNIIAGGTGKTPLTLLLALEMCNWGHLAVVSRGYRSKAEKLAVPVFLSRKGKKLFSSVTCGDEPFLLAENLPEASVIVGKDRVRASQMAVESGAQMILMDDGMQHRRLARDFEVAVLDARVPLGHGHFLPRGLLRDSPKSLSRADLIFINKVKSFHNIDEIERLVRRYSDARIVAARNIFVSACYSNKTKAPDLKGVRVGIFCGIAQPHDFFETVKEAGAEIVHEHYFSDHEEASIPDLEKIADKSREAGAELLLCTEKDWVKIQSKDRFSLPLAWAQVSMEIVYGKESWEQFLFEIKNKVAATTL